MIKHLVLVLVMIATIPTAFAQSTPICDDIIPLRTNCTFITPSISCNVFDYDVFYKNSTPVLNGEALSPFNDTVYQFNWTLTEETEDYLVRLCDGTTREVIVQAGGREGNNMSFVAIAIFSIGVMGLLSWVGLNLSKIITSENEGEARLTPIKVLFLVVALLLSLGFINLNRIIAQDANMPAGVISLFSTFYTVGVVVMMFVGFISFAYYLLLVVNMFRLNRSNKDADRFDR